MKHRALCLAVGLGLCFPVIHADGFFGKNGSPNSQVKSLWVELSNEDASRNRIPLPSIAPLVENAENAVLVVATESVVKQNQPMMPPGYERGPFRDFFKFFGPPPGGQQPEYRAKGQGSGFIIHPSGYALTNHHVVGDASTIVVKAGSDPQDYKAELIGSDEDTDVALIRIISDKKAWPVIPLGSSNNFKVGDFAVAIGNPLGLGLSVSMGIVSARGRKDVRPSGKNGLYDFIQIDAPINLGNSGGPVLNLAGEAMGINTAISASGQGIAFAIPIDQVKLLLPQLKDTGRITRSWIGVSIHNVDPKIAAAMGLSSPQGALVREVVAGGPGEKAGIEAGDIIVEFDGKAVADAASLQVLAGLAGAGKSIPVTVFRNGKNKMLKVTLQAMPKEDKGTANIPEQAPSTGIDSFGFSVTTLDAKAKEHLKLDNSLKGARVTRVEPNTAAQEAGFKPNDVITKVNDKPIENANQLVDAFKKVKPGEMLRIFVRRGKSTIFVAMPKP